MRRLRFVFPVNQCNYSCTFCHREGFSLAFENKPLVKPDKFASIANQILLLEPTLKGIVISGGEPCTCQNLEEYFLYVNITNKLLVTNGSLLNNTLPLRLLRSGVNKININIPSCQEDEYLKLTGQNKHNLKKIVYNIKCCLDLGFPIQLNCPLVKKEQMSYDWLSQYLRFAKVIGISSVVFIEDPNIESKLTFNLLKSANFLNYIDEQKRGYHYLFDESIDVYLITCGENIFYDYSKSDFGDVYLSWYGEEYIPKWINMK